MLELHPNCECCDKDLPPSATDACPETKLACRLVKPEGCGSFASGT